eukprot:4648762-Pleurochrysis_carterae.AAC.2
MLKATIASLNEVASGYKPALVGDGKLWHLGQLVVAVARHPRWLEPELPPPGAAEPHAATAVRVGVQNLEQHLTLLLDCQRRVLLVVAHL